MERELFYLYLRPLIDMAVAELEILGTGAAGLELEAGRVNNFD